MPNLSALGDDSEANRIAMDWNCYRGYLPEARSGEAKGSCRLDSSLDAVWTLEGSRPALRICDLTTITQFAPLEPVTVQHLFHLPG
jgi:hypothetical protein